MLARRLLDLGVVPGARLKIAYSGGLDSQVLLHALAGLRAEYNFTLAAVHVDHGLHADSQHWAEHCRRVCRRLDVELYLERVTVRALRGEGLEAAARHGRYAALARRTTAGETLLTAHHRDDQVETLLLQLLRGAGVHGLGAMSPAVPFAAGMLLRPLLDVPRAMLQGYAERHGLVWIEDPSNVDVGHARNFLRHRVLPVLKQRWPQMDDAVARAAANCSDAASLLDEQAAGELLRCRADDTALSVSALLAVGERRLPLLLRYWIRQQGFNVPSRRHLDQIIACLQSTPRSAHAIVRWPGAEIHRYRDTVQLLDNLEPFDPQLSLRWQPGELLAIPGTGYGLCAVTVTGEGLAHARLRGADLRVQLRRGGERCRLPGQAHHRTLKNLLQEAGVPPWQRRRLPLVYVNGELAAVGDRWVCDPFAAAADDLGWRLRCFPLGAARGSR